MDLHVCSPLIMENVLLVCCLSVYTMCASLMLGPMGRFYSYLVLKNLSIIDQCPVNLKIAAPK
jgi:hypothetical protein